MSPVCLLVAVLLVGVARGAVDHRHPSFQLQCLQLCQSDSTEIPLIPGTPGLHLPPLFQRPPLLRPSAPTPWSTSLGKPVGSEAPPHQTLHLKQCRRGVSRGFPAEVMRRDTEQRANTLEDQLRDVQEKKDSVYKMKHFRWSGPLPGKRTAREETERRPDTAPLSEQSSKIRTQYVLILH
uniref:Uncharacterized protein n=1 Tax=Echeneis naucrates TaxID=173247 RepID=A0A665UKF1_ECHNA